MSFLYSTSSDSTTDSLATTESPATTDSPPTTTFIYYNSSTQMLEGISMQSTYSIFKLNPYKIFTLITTTSFPLYTPASSNRKILTHSSASLIPLYHQFIYSINVFNYLPSLEAIRADLTVLLNEQTAQASKLRVHILKTIGHKLSLTPTSLRINWIEKLNAENKSAENSNYEQILVSLSSVPLLDLQNSYSEAIRDEDTTRANKLSDEYEQSCTDYFNRLSEAHRKDFSTFRVDFLELVYPSERFVAGDESAGRTERVEKVQLLKLCSLKSIYSILELGGERNENQTGPNRLLPKQLKLANTLIKSSTEEIEFTGIEEPLDLDDKNADNINSTSADYEVLGEKAEVISFKSDIGQAQTNQTSETMNETLWYTNATEQLMARLEKYKNALVAWFWRVVPEEDFLLAVVVPVIVITSLIIFTIVSVCILQMCNNKECDESKQQIASMSNTTDLSLLPGAAATTTLKKKSEGLVNERAYMSKGVPVILYEEMSDKPIDDYDENQRDVMDISGCETIGRSYRSPLIMRHEKPPTPAPPEYSRADFMPSLDTHVIVNELSEETSQLLAVTRTSSSSNVGTKRIVSLASNGRNSQNSGHYYYRPLDECGNSGNLNSSVEKSKSSIK